MKFRVAFIFVWFFLSAHSGIVVYQMALRNEETKMESARLGMVMSVAWPVFLVWCVRQNGCAADLWRVHDIAL